MFKVLTVVQLQAVDDAPDVARCLCSQGREVPITDSLLAGAEEGRNQSELESEPRRITRTPQVREQLFRTVITASLSSG